MNTPVALILFNRAETTSRVFAEIAKAKPKKLFLIADGPRPTVQTDIEKCAEARAVVAQVDWECDVQRKFSDDNLSCGLCPATGLTWVFEQVDRAIVLEDDCVPDPSFFPFCDEILERYRDDERIMHIAGNNFQENQRFGNASYFFSRHNICLGGWATWARAWQQYDFELKGWPALRNTPWLEYVVGEPRGAAVWRRIFDEAHRVGAEASYSDYQWTFTCWAENGLSVIPNVELCRNIGFDHDPTHVFADDCPWRVAQTEPIQFPLVHPASVTPDAAADLAFNERVLMAEGVRPHGFREKISKALSLFR